jgi:hypothetical protein
MIGTAAGEAVSVKTLTTPQRRLVDLIRNHPGLFRAQAPNKMLFRFQWVPGAGPEQRSWGITFLAGKLPGESWRGIVKLLYILVSRPRRDP